MSKIILHHLNHSRSQRILWLLEELNIPYEIVRYQRNPKTLLAPPELRKIHPLGKSPVIQDGDVTLAESAAIIEYLVEKYGQNKLKPSAGTKEAHRYTYWLHYAEGSAMPPLLLNLVFTQIKKQPVPFFVKPIVKGIADKVMKTFVRPQTKLHMDYVESELKKSTWFAGNEFSAVDIQMSFPLEAAQARDAINSEQHPSIYAFIERIRARPAYKQAREKEGAGQTPFEA